jgi:RNA:NAD 2'-phosphotransferase (TPT1/KptA family)
LFKNNRKIKPMSRQYVHLSRTAEPAAAIGKRHGEPVVLKTNAKAIFEKGYKFCLSENKVWLVDYVPKEDFKIYFALSLFDGSAVYNTGMCKSSARRNDP